MGCLRDVVHTPFEIGQGGVGLVESIGEMRIYNAYHPSYEKVFVLGEIPRVLEDLDRLIHPSDSTQEGHLIGIGCAQDAQGAQI